jgi:rhodanese-related sulfurtransferase
MSTGVENDLPLGIDQILADARRELDRLHPIEAHNAQRSGALVVDIRPALNRESEGEIPGSLIVERNVLEWRLDPASTARIPEASYDLHVVVVCNEGYTSSLAAATLHLLGVRRATDVVGGFRAWRARGLPVVSGGTATGRYVRGREFSQQPTVHQRSADAAWAGFLRHTSGGNGAGLDRAHGRPGG